jgi:hypothetical protein
MIHIPKGLKKVAPYQTKDHYGRGFITYEAHLRAYAIYSAIYGTGQSAARLAERGGFGEYELDTFYPEWRNHIVKDNKQNNDES